MEGPISSVFIDLMPSVPLSDSREGVISLAESSALEAGCDTSSENSHLLSVEIGSIMSIEFKVFMFAFDLEAKCSDGFSHHKSC